MLQVCRNDCRGWDSLWVFCRWRRLRRELQRIDTALSSWMACLCSSIFLLVFFLECLLVFLSAHLLYPGLWSLPIFAISLLDLFVMLDCCLVLTLAWLTFLKPYVFVYLINILNCISLAFDVCIFVLFRKFLGTNVTELQVLKQTKFVPKPWTDRDFHAYSHSTGVGYGKQGHPVGLKVLGEYSELQCPREGRQQTLLFSLKFHAVFITLHIPCIRFVYPICQTVCVLWQYFIGMT